MKPRAATRSLLLAFLTIGSASCVSGPLSTTGMVHRRSYERFEGGEITVVSLNMLHGFADKTNDRTLEDRLELLIGELILIEPDIVLLQEASVTSPRRHGNVVDRIVDELNRHFKYSVSDGSRSYDHVFIVAHGSRLIGFFEGSAVISRYSITSAQSLTYRAQSLFPPEQRIAVAARIDTAENPMFVVSTHLTNTDSERGGGLVRDLQAMELAEFIRMRNEDGLTIIGGDLNATPDSDTVTSLLEAGARDTWAEHAEVAASGKSVGATSLAGSVVDPHARRVRRIDYLLILEPDHDRAAEVVEAEVAFKETIRSGSSGLRISDHAGLVLKLHVAE